MQSILVCDDDKQIVEAIDIYLTGEGFEVIKAYDGAEALELLKTHTVNLMILDVMMPGLDGIRTTLKVRETSSIPIIILSAKSDPFRGCPISFLLTALSFQMEVSILIACEKIRREKYATKKETSICNRGICRCECSCLCDSGNPWKYRKFGVYGKNGGGLAAICEAGRILETVYSYFYAFWI